MDIATFLGIIAGIALIVLAIRENIFLFLSLRSAMITFGGALAATFINFPLSQVAKVFKVAGIAFFSSPPDPDKTVDTIIRLSEKARREGFLALEPELANINDKFIKRGVQDVIDGVSRDRIKETMDKQLAFLTERHSMGQQIFISMGTYSPAFGMCGTLIGLIIMLYNLDDPKKVGPGMALAITTTLYGVLAAYLIFLPIAGKLNVISEQEKIVKEVAIEGILALQAGDSPRFIRARLSAFLAPRMEEMKRRKAESKAKIGREMKNKKGNR
ncbi:MAG: motility protein A [Candidatus Omnitrophica bacterium]|nr:motility protein A [Candidatus Omnitrophota bacterium]MBD3269142.1 motility protein A [Candidatus Omnitrophota bacterium]